MTEGEDPSVLIGGMAVSAWSEIHLEPAEHAVYDLPIYSKDVGLRGPKATSLLLAQTMAGSGAEIRGTVTAIRKNAPHMGRVFATSLFWKGQQTSIEVLERLPGLDTGIDDLPVGTPLLTRGGLSLLDPCSLFICKLHAANTRPQGEAGNDIKHLAILARVIPRFLEKLRATPVAEYDAKEDVRRLLRQIEDSEAGRHPFKSRCLRMKSQGSATLCAGTWGEDAEANLTAPPDFLLEPIPTIPIAAPSVPTSGSAPDFALARVAAKLEPVNPRTASPCAD